MVRRIGQAKASLAADYTAQLARSVGKVVFFAKHIDVMDTAERQLAEAELRTVSIRGDQTSTARQQAIDAFQKDPDVSVAVCSLHRRRGGPEPARRVQRRAGRAVLDRGRAAAGHRPGAPDRPGRAGHRVAHPGCQTIDSKIAELIDAKQGLAARALDGSDEKGVSGDSVQLDALIHLLREALRGSSRG